MSAYEFSSEDNRAILTLAKRMQAVSILLGVTGLLAIGNAIPGLLEGGAASGIGGLIVGAIAIVQAIVFFRPTDNLKNIVTTEGEDIDELMQGMGELAVGLKTIVILLSSIAVVVVSTVAIST